MKALLFGLLLNFSGAETLNPHNGFIHFDNVLDTIYVYEYDSYTLENYNHVKVDGLDYTNKFYSTDSSFVYLKYNDQDTVEFIEANFGDKLKQDKTLKYYLQLFKNIDIEDLDVKFVYSDFKFIGLDVDGVLYSLVKLEVDKTEIVTRPNPKFSVLQQKNQYEVYTLNGKLISSGTNLTSFDKINSTQFSAGVYVIHIIGSQNIITTTHTVK